MKFLTIVIGMAGVAAIAGALAVGCGPKKAYCPQFSTGQCVDQDTGMATGTGGTGAGDATILGDDV
jgi:hypothetical protein